MPKVYNKRQGDAPRDAVYVGRPTMWGNPYTHLQSAAKKHPELTLVETREEAVRRYRTYIRSRRSLRQQVATLRDKDLVCWCAPLPCHADVLLELANEAS